MALSDMVFTNNLGSITLTRVMYSIDHRYKWEGDGPVKNSVSITVNGKIKTDEDTINTIHGSGEWGSLVLPNGTYGNIKLIDITYADGIWAPWGDVSVTFDNDNEDTENDFEITFVSEGFEYTIYNPSIVVTPSKIRRGERVIRGVDGWFRQQLGHDMVTVNVSGTIKTDDCALPEGLTEALSPKSTIPELAQRDYPRVADFSEYFPDAVGNLEIKKVLITEAKIIWQFEDKLADLNITMIAPPQLIV